MLIICYEKDGEKLHETANENTDILSWYNAHPDYKNIMVFSTANDLLNQKIENYRRFLSVCESFGINSMEYGQRVKLSKDGVTHTVKLVGIITRCKKYKILWEYCDMPQKHIRTTPEYARYLLENFAEKEG